MHQFLMYNLVDKTLKLSDKPILLTKLWLLRSPNVTLQIQCVITG